jgi:hypothetical protein
MIVAGKMDWRLAFYRLSLADFSKALQATVWASVRMKALDNLAPAPQGLRNTSAGALTEIRLRHRTGLQEGDYAVHGARLWHVVNLRDPDGKGAELIASAHELIGMPATYTPAGGAAVTTRAWLGYSAPFVPGQHLVNEYRLRAEVPIYEVGRPARGDALTVGGRNYLVVGLVDNSDDGVVRGLWVTSV